MSQHNLARSFVFLLILAVVPAVSIMPSTVSSQSMTITTQATTTGLYTTPVATQYASTTETSYVYGPEAYTIQAEGLFCHGDVVKLNATQGQQFHIEWTTTAQIPSSLNFYITTPSAYNANWYCDTGPEALHSSSGVKGSVDWSAPSTGQFMVLLYNYNLNPVSVTLSIETSAISTITSISYATATTINLLTTLQIVPASSSFTSTWIIGAIGIVVLVIALGFSISRRTKAEQKRKEIAEGVHLCRICGAKLVPNARFCKKCGTPVKASDTGTTQA